MTEKIRSTGDLRSKIKANSVTDSCFKDQLIPLPVLFKLLDTDAQAEKEKAKRLEIPKDSPLRIGQAIFAAINSTMRIGDKTHEEWDAAIGHRLFNIEDDELIQALAELEAQKQTAEEAT